MGYRNVEVVVRQQSEDPKLPTEISAFVVDYLTEQQLQAIAAAAQSPLKNDPEIALWRGIDPEQLAVDLDEAAQKPTQFPAEHLRNLLRASAAIVRSHAESPD